MFFKHFNTPAQKIRWAGFALWLSLPNLKTALCLTIAAFGLATFQLSAATLYVSLESTNPVPPYTTWTTAATNIQEAVDATKAGDTVLVTNGVYAVGGREVSVLDSNQEPPQLVSRGGSRVAVRNAIRLESVNGPLVTKIDGSWDRNSNSGVRCVYLGTNAVLSGFTLTNGFVLGQGGGGVFCEPDGLVTNCTLTGNIVVLGRGGGASGGTLYNCTLTGNSAVCGGGEVCVSLGGGAYGSTLYNCTLSGNYAHGWAFGPLGGGGGAYGCILYNCTLLGNSSGVGGGGASESTLYNCTVTGNSGGQVAGGASGSTLYNCTVTGNYGGGVSIQLWGHSALYNCTVTGNSGYGASGGTLFNCIVFYNSGGNYAEGTMLNYCCTTPLPTNGVGNINGPPLFMDFEAEDYHLWEGSPCIDAGTNLIGFTIMATNGETGEITVATSYAHDPTDMLGNTRFIDGNFDGRVAWDIGAYEFNSFKAPRFSSAPQLTSDGWKLNITGAPNKWVRLQRSSDLKNWEDVWLWPQSNPFFMGSDGVKQVNDGDMGQQAMFYRVVVE